MDVEIDFRGYKIEITKAKIRILDSKGSELYNVHAFGLDPDLLISNVVSWFKGHKKSIPRFDENELRQALRDKLGLNKIKQISSKITVINPHGFQTHATNQVKVVKPKVMIQDEKFIEIVKKANKKNSWRDLLLKAKRSELEKFQLDLQIQQLQFVLKKVIFGLPLRKSLIVNFFGEPGKTSSQMNLSFSFSYISVVENDVIKISNVNKVPTISQYHILNQLFIIAPEVKIVGEKIAIDYSWNFLRTDKLSEIVFAVPETMDLKKAFFTLVKFLLTHTPRRVILVFVSYEEPDIINELRKETFEKINSFGKDLRNRVSFIDFELFTNVELKQLLDYLNEIELREIGQ